MYKHKKINIQFPVFVFLVMVSCMTGCKKFVEVEVPPTRVAQENVYDNDQTAIAVLTRIHAQHVTTERANIQRYMGMLSDEFTLWSGAVNVINTAYYTNAHISLDALNQTGVEMWNNYYNSVFVCNSAIEGVSASKGLTPSVKTQLLGEAYFTRAWYYFMLVNLYGDVPLVTGIDPQINRQLSRSATSAVYDVIVSDLNKAKEYLSKSYLDGKLSEYASNPERVRPTYWAASALLARAYLYMGEYGKSEAEATIVIGHTEKFELVSNANVFLKNSREAILQSQPTAIGFNTPEGRQFNLREAPTGLSTAKPVYLSSFLLSSFETGDKRRSTWIDSIIAGGITYYFPSKYKIGAQNASVTTAALLSEYSMILRLGEQYLIRGESRARQNNLSGAIADLDAIRKRSSIALIANTNPGISQAALLNAFLQERKVELFTELGHRWFDLKRTGKVDEVMNIVTPNKGGTWQVSKRLLPIPFAEILYNPNLTQNPGY